jgi:hypothetical protein
VLTTKGPGEDLVNVVDEAMDRAKKDPPAGGYSGKVVVTQGRF